MSSPVPGGFLGDAAPGRSRIVLLATFAALAVFANSLGNGFAFDDGGIVVENPFVTGGDLRVALAAPWWVDVDGGGVLYRPLTLVSFAVEWALSGGDPFLFHAVNVGLHGVATALVALLLLRLGARPWGALAGALFFAVHPVHVEAVANVVGRAELYAAIPFVAACLVYLTDVRSGLARALRLFAIGGLYLAGLLGKEIAVTLPAALVLLEIARPLLHRAGEPTGEGSPSWPRRVLAEAPVFLLLGVVLVAYLGVRLSVLGSVRGEIVHPAFVGAPGGAPVLTGLTLWPHYVRLMLVPWDLSADYDPAVIPLQTGLSVEAALGGATLLALSLLAVLTRRRLPLVSLGIAWFLITVLPVSHLVLHPAVFLAERTLYLPSVGIAAVVAGSVAWALARARPTPVPLAAAGVLALALLAVRTVTRNPVWFSTHTVMDALYRDHPESWRAHLSRGGGLERAGAWAEAADEYELALRLLPHRLGTLVAAGRAAERAGRLARGEEILREAVALYPDEVSAYRALAAFLLRRGRGREAHRTATEGLRRTRWDAVLLAHLGESYVLGGDLPAAIRARGAALALEPGASEHQARLAELLRALEPHAAPNDPGVSDGTGGGGDPDPSGGPWP